MTEIFYRPTLGAKRSCTLGRGRRLDRARHGSSDRNQSVLHDAKEPHPFKIRSPTEESGDGNANAGDGCPHPCDIEEYGDGCESDCTLTPMPMP